MTLIGVEGSGAYEVVAIDGVVVEETIPFEGTAG